MTDSPRKYGEAIAFAANEAQHPSQDWTGFCQKFVRSCYAIPALYGSAYAQWLGVDPENKHAGGNPDDAPLGSALCFKGSNPFGHIDLAGRPFKDGRGGAWSNDLVVYGDIDKVLRTAPITAWGQNYLGYITEVNGYDLQLKVNKPPKPIQDKQYKSIDRAVNKMEHALETAKAQHDHKDIDVIKAEIHRLKKMYAHLRHS